MTATVLVPYEFDNLASFTTSEVVLWNWWCRLLAEAPSREAILAEALADVLPEVASETSTLITTNSLEPEKPPQPTLLERERVLIGRTPDNDIVLPMKTITKNHAQLTHRPDGWVVEDLGSNMGTYRGPRRLTPGQPEPLYDGQQFSIFPYAFELRTELKWTATSHVDVAHPMVERIAWSELRRRSGPGWIGFPLHLEPLGQPIWMEVTETLVRAIVHRLLAQQTATAEITPVEETLVQFAFLGAMERFSRALKFPFHLSFGRSAPLAADLGPGYTVTIPIAIGAANGIIRLFVSTELMASVQGALPDRAASKTRHRDVCWPFAISRGHVDLSADAQSHVEPGDVLLYESHPRLLFPARANGAWSLEIVTEQPWSFRIDNYVERILEMNATEGTGPLGELGVRVHVLLGEKELTLAELESLAPGSILALDRGKTDPVQLAINGKLAGEGQLVEIDGRLGVKIQSWRTA